MKPSNMYTTQFPSVRVGQATLFQNELKVGSKPYSLNHRKDFAAFALMTSAVVGTAISTLFPADTGILAFGDGVTGSLHPGIEPWQQYANAAMVCGSDLAQAKVVIGWCALLDLYSHLVPSPSVDQDAVALARYIASVGFKAAYASLEDVEAWFEYQALKSTPQGFKAFMEGTLEQPPDPWAGAFDLVLPAAVSLKPISALEVIEQTNGDIVLCDGGAKASAGTHHLIECTDDVSPVERRSRDYCIALSRGGSDYRFRVHTIRMPDNADEVVLRKLSTQAPTLDLAALL